MVVCATLSLRGGNGSGRRGNPLYAMGAYGQYGLLTGSQWIATGYALAMTKVLECRVRFHDNRQTLSLRGGSGSGRRGNPLYAMGAYGEYGSLTGSQWIATGLRPRDDKAERNRSVRFGYNTIFVIARRSRK